MLPVPGAVALVGGAAVYIRSAIVRTRHEELQVLADTRGDRITDLEAKVGRLEDKVSRLETELAAQSALVTEAIATRVAELLAPRLPRRSDAPA